MEVKITNLTPCPWNPRSEFDGEAMDQLIASIKTHGVLEPLVVRPKGKSKTQYEIVAGERRYMAAKRAKLKAVPVTVRELSDRAAREITVTENLQRDDLNAIDEARGFAMLLEGEDAPTQTDLAGRLGCSQAHIANRLRLLKLPAEWHKRIISREIPASYARELVPWTKYPHILEAIWNDASDRIKRGDDLGSARMFADDVLDCVQNNARAVGHQAHVSGFGWAPPMKLTAEQEAELDVIEIQGPYNKTKSRIAMNAKLFDKLQAAHIAKWKAAKEKKAGAGGKAAAGSNGKPKKLTPAEQKRRDKDRAELFRRRLWEFKVDWLRYEIGRTLRDYDNDRDDVMLLLLWLAARRPATGGMGTMDVVRKAMRAAKLKHSSNFAVSVMQITDTDTDLVGLICRCLAAWFVDDTNDPLPYIFDDDVLAIASRLAVDLEKEWGSHRAGQLTERYFVLHDKEQLVELAAACKLRPGKEDLKTKAALVGWFMAQDKMPYPKELDKIKRPR